jgi:MFS family permease
LLKRDFGFDPVQLGWIGSAFAWVYAGAAPLAGVLADRLTRRRIIIGACLVWSCFTLATAWCSGVGTFIAVRALTGLGEAFYFPAAMSLVSDYHDRRTRSRALSWHQSGVYAGTILGSWLAAVLAAQSGWRFPFYWFGPLGVLLAVVLSRWLCETGRGAADALQGGQVGPRDAAAAATLPARETLALIARTPAALLLMLAFLGANFVAVVFLTWTPTFLVEKFRFSVGAAGLNGTLYIHLASAVAVPLAGWLADRLTPRYAGGRMTVQAGGLIAGAFFVFLVGTTGRISTLIAAMAVFGFCKGFYDSGIFASLYDTIEPRARGTAAGLINTVGWGGAALGPLFVGLATRYGRRPQEWQNMSEAIAWCGAIYLLAAALVLAAMAFHARSRNRLAPPA